MITDEMYQWTVEFLIGLGFIVGVYLLWTRR